MLKLNPQKPTSVLRFPVPSFHNLIVEPLEEIQPKGSRIIIPDMVKEKPTEGIIISVGPGRRTPNGERVQMEFKAGQRVIFNRYAGTDIRYNGKNYIVISEDEIKAFFP